MSPTNSMRTGSASAAGNMSTMPPRTANAPCSSTGSSRVKPASTSRSANRCGSISVPARISIEARSSRSRRAHARAAARRRTRRSGGPCQLPRHGARGPARPPRGSAASCRDTGSTCMRRKGQHGLLDRCRGRALERAIEEARVGRHLLDVPVGRHDEQRHAALPSAAAMTAASALPPGVRPAVTGARPKRREDRTSSPSERPQRQRWSGRRH